MLRLILFILIFLALYYLFRFLMKGMFSLQKRKSNGSEPEELVQDPYCQTYIPIRSALRKRIKGRDYYFCNQDCLNKFLRRKSS
jgi:YHS domain-containing protein